jgi:hypothetical protein
VRYYLDVTDGSGNALGTLTIGINPGKRGDVFFWEWNGPGMAEGGPAVWRHDGHGFQLELRTGPSGHLRAVVTDGPAWQVPAGSRGEPPRPWFRTGGAQAGVGSRLAPGPPPQALLPGFNWTLRASGARP